MSLATPLGPGVGPMLGEWMYRLSGITPLLWFCAGLGAVSVVLSALTWDARLMAAASQRSAAGRADDNFWSYLLEPRMQVPVLVMLLVGLMIGIAIAFLPLFVDSLAVSFQPGYFFSSSALASFAVRPLIGLTSDRIGRGPFISIALVAYILSMVTLGHAQTNADFFLAGLIEGLGAGCLLPNAIALVSERGHPRERGRLMALCTGGFDVGMAIAGPIFGLSTIWLSYRHLFLISAVLGAIALYAFLLYNSTTPRQSLQFAFGRVPDRFAVKSLEVQPVVALSSNDSQVQAN